MSLQIDVISDIVCPWCYIGKRSLRDALGRLQGPRRVRWHPMQLYPDVPPQGTDLIRYLEARFGNMPAVYAAMEQLREAGLKLGIRFDFDKIARLPNTLDAHRLLLGVADTQQDILLENLFAGFFEHGLDLSDREVLLGIGVDSGVPADQAAEILHDPATRDEVIAEQQRVKQLGLTGLPNFLVNQRLSVVGAHDVDTLLQAFDFALFGPPDANAPTPILH